MEIRYWTRIIGFSYILFGMSCPAMGQVCGTKKPDASGSQLWGTLEAGGISNNGKWVQYTVRYESGNDTLFVKNTKTKTRYALAKGSNGKFMAEGVLACGIGNTATLLDLERGTKTILNNVDGFSVTSRAILCYQYLEDGTTALRLYTPKGQLLWSETGITSYALNPLGSALAYVSTSNGRYAMNLLAPLSIKAIASRVPVPGNGQLRNPTWQGNGTAMAFSGSDANGRENRIYHYGITTGVLKSADADQWNGYRPEAGDLGKLGISDDGQRVFFRLRKEGDSLQKSDIQVWNGADRDLYPLHADSGPELLACWRLQNDTLSLLGDASLAEARLNGNQKFALLYDPNRHKPCFSQVVPVDYTAEDLKTGERAPIAKDIRQPMRPSPGGGYVAYFRDGNWWTYCFATKRQVNLTGKNAFPVYEAYSWAGEQDQPCTWVRWAADDSFLLLGDAYDYFAYSPDGTSSRKLTSGRDSSLVYRLFEQSIPYSDGVVGKEKGLARLEGLVFRVESSNQMYSGYSKITKNAAVHPIVFGQNKVQNFMQSASGASVWTQEDFREPPALKSSESKMLYRSNAQMGNVPWGKSELMAYTNSKGDRLHGVLVYPSNYNPELKYPMIVYVYQKLTEKLHDYKNPSLYNGCDLNAPYFSTLGYFILFPEIVYEIGKPGFSAADCTVAATKEALRRIPAIDGNRIGLMGHSFGGFEASFIITQTTLFRAAIAGAGITDFTSNYLTLGASDFKSQGWRYESYQMRMGTTLFDDVQAYRENSPITHAAKVTTPLFSYTGLGDLQVDPRQTMEFYFALRRLGRECTMVLYPNEGHVFSGKAHQADFTAKVREWFGYYLKGEPKPDWTVAK